MMFSNQLEHIQKQKEKAFSVFHKTRIKLLKTIDHANQCIGENELQIAENDEKNQELKDTNETIKGHITEIRDSLGQIDSILGQKND